MQRDGPDRHADGPWALEFYDAALSAPSAARRDSIWPARSASAWCCQYVRTYARRSTATPDAPRNAVAEDSAFKMIVCDSAFQEKQNTIMHNGRTAPLRLQCMAAAAALARNRVSEGAVRLNGWRRVFGSRAADGMMVMMGRASFRGPLQRRAGLPSHRGLASTACRAYYCLRSRWCAGGGQACGGQDGGRGRPAGSTWTTCEAECESPSELFPFMRKADARVPAQSAARRDALAANAPTGSMEREPTRSADQRCLLLLHALLHTVFVGARIAQPRCLCLWSRG